MRISDWNADVCSSDLERRVERVDFALQVLRDARRAARQALDDLDGAFTAVVEVRDRLGPAGKFMRIGAAHRQRRSDERSVGNDSASTCRTRWPQHTYNQIQTHNNSSS